MLCQEGGQLPGCVQTGYAIRAFFAAGGLVPVGFKHGLLSTSEPGAVYRSSALRENGDSRAGDPEQHAGDTVLRQHRLQAGSAHL